jgi:hypothetical protein
MAPSAMVLAAASPSTGADGAPLVTPMVKVCEPITPSLACGDGVGMAGPVLEVDLAGIGDVTTPGGVDGEAAEEVSPTGCRSGLGR